MDGYSEDITQLQYTLLYPIPSMRKISASAFICAKKKGATNAAGTNMISTAVRIN
ncbi:MAG: hypothetical protein ACI8W1_003335 [Candidatus Azotimanducaceae bacterium]